MLFALYSEKQGDAQLFMHCLSACFLPFDAYALPGRGSDEDADICFPVSWNGPGSLAALPVRECRSAHGESAGDRADFCVSALPRITNSSILYLLVILPLASTRGRYAATLASLVAFFSFDFFLVPPFYSFVIYRAEEWIALVIFLVAALLTGNLAAALSQRAREALRRESETRALYHLVQSVSGEEAPEGQLRAICHAAVSVLAPLGVRDCEILAAEASPGVPSRSGQRKQGRRSG